MRHRRLFVATLTAALAISGLVATPVAADDEPAYYLPAPFDTGLIVTAGNDHPTGRVDTEQYAFDFISAEGPRRFEVVAARGGTVMSVRPGERPGKCDEPLDGPRPDCWRKVNYVLIDHGDGTSALYMHLHRGDPLVRRGQVVSTGQTLGFAGKTGWTDQAGLQFQVQRTPRWNEVGRGGWFQTQSLPVSFADEDVLVQRSDGVPETDDTVVSANPGAAFEPFRFRRRPRALPAAVPFEVGADRVVSRAYDADSPDGYGLHFAAAVDPLGEPDPFETDPDLEEPLADPGTKVRPLFGGELAFAGCASGESASLGRTVAISFEHDEDSYLGVLGHLSEIEPSLLDLDPELPPLIIGPNELLGYYGTVLGPDESPTLECPDADPGATDLFAAILRDATVSPEGEISGGIPVSPEPLVGELGYEGLAWWSGPLVATEIDELPGRPRPRWTKKTPAHASHVPFGDQVRLTARVRDVADIAEVRFRAWYEDWPRVADTRDMDSFDPTTSWRLLASCSLTAPSGEPGASDCRWTGEPTDATVTFLWDPSAVESGPAAPWLPRARGVIDRDSTECVAVSFATEVIDHAGHVYSQVGNLPLPTACDDPKVDADDRGLVLYLDPLVPPKAPVRVSSPNWRWFQQPDFLEGQPDPDGNEVRWRDRADNEDGYRVYARRNYFTETCDIAQGPWVFLETLPPDTRRYTPRHNLIIRQTPVVLPEAPGTLTAYRLYISAFNEAGESKRTYVGSFAREAFFTCDTGLAPPPELEP